ncbi:MAG: hypothetical protein KC416_10205 [Myxococcales bacterium]|nr:hypothetical protein [Myxococcales bacterium]
MERITREAFVGVMGEQGGLSLEGAGTRDLRALGLHRADGNGDGRIEGQKEYEQLFALIDQHDRNGDVGSVTPGKGRTTRALQVIARLTENLSLGRAARRGRHADVTYLGMNPASEPREIAGLRRRGVRLDVIAHQEMGGPRRAGSEGPRLRHALDDLGLPAAQTSHIQLALERAPRESRDELLGLARLWADGEKGLPMPGRLVISGHGTSSVALVYGDHGDLYLKSIADLARAMPKAAAQVKHVHISACNQGHPEQIAQWQATFTEMETFWAYDDTAPSGEFGGTDSHLGTWEAMTRRSRAPRPSVIHRLHRSQAIVFWTRTEGVVTR